MASVVSPAPSRRSMRLQPVSVHATQHLHWRWELWRDMDELLDFELVSLPSTELIPRLPSVPGAAGPLSPDSALSSDAATRAKLRARTVSSFTPLASRLPAKPKAGGIMKWSMKKRRELDVSRKLTITNEDEYKERASMIELLSDDEELSNKRKRRNEELLEEVQRSPELARAIEVFKKNPSEAIEILLQAKLIEEDTFEAIAAFLFKFRDIFDRKIMGDYLSTRPEDQKPGERDINAMLYAFVRNIDFTHIDFDLALRRYLYCFHLPGEAQKIDRLVQKFADHYFTFARDIFQSTLVVYSLSFSVIMLNTDAHNQNVFEKMTRQQFVDNSQHNNCESLSTEYLEDLYYRIVLEEIKFTAEEAKLPDALKKGWVQFSVNGKVPKRRWIVLAAHFLHVYRKIEDSKPVMYVALQDIELSTVVQRGRRGLKIAPMHTEEEADTETKNSFVLFTAPTEAEMNKWHLAIEAFALRSDPGQREHENV